MESWLPKLERALEIAAETGHDDFRCFLSAEAPPLPDQQSVPEGSKFSSESNAVLGCRLGGGARQGLGLQEPALLCPLMMPHP